MTGTRDLDAVARAIVDDNRYMVLGTADASGMPWAADARETLRSVRTNLTLDDLEGFLEEPHLAVLATVRSDGTSLLSPVWHRWRDGGFEFWVGADDVKVRHLRRDPRATVLVAETVPPYRGVEVRGRAVLLDGDLGVAVEIASRYVGPERGAAFAADAEGDRIVRVAPGELRVWDFADDFPAG